MNPSSFPQKDPILITGTVAFDHLMNYPRRLLEEMREVIAQEVLSVSFYPDRYEKRPGGTGANIAWNVALLGGNAMLVANVGPDANDYLKILQERGINTKYIEVKQTVNTSMGVCLSDPKGHQIWFFFRGADTIGHWPQIEKKDRPAYAIIGARDNKQMLEGLEWCHAEGVPSLFDPGHEILNFTPEQLERAASLATGSIMNEFEWNMFAERINVTPEKVVEKAEYLIITKGENGYTIVTKDGSNDYPRCNCDTPVNPTGAGDAFRAGLIHGLTSHWSLEQSSKLGAAIASFVVEQEGTHLPTLNRDSLQERVREAYGEELPDLAI